MLSRRQKVSLACACLFVLVALALAIVHFADGAWIQGTLWIGAAACFAAAYAMSLTRSAYCG